MMAFLQELIGSVRGQATRERALRRHRVIVPAAALLMASVAQGDDTEVFFDQSAAGSSSPNILFVLPTGRTMGCEIGSTGACETALTNGKSRMDVLKDALVLLMEQLVDEKVDVNIGFMRGNNNGSDGSAAAKGGLIAQEVSAVDEARLAELKKWICPRSMSQSDCYLVMPNGTGPGQLMLTPSNDASFDKLGSGKQQLTEILFEANRYYAGRRERWGSNAGIGPSYSFPGKDYSPSQIWGPATKDPSNCPGQFCEYDSPANQCQTNFIILLSDGILAGDTGNDLGADSISNSAGDPAPYNKWFKIYTDSEGLTSGLSNGCSKNTGINYQIIDPKTGKPTKDKISDCSDDLVFSMRNGGFVDGQLGAQVFTYTVGFDVTAATTAENTPSKAPTDLLKMLARAGGGKYYATDCDGCDPEQAAKDLAELFRDIVDEVVISNASFTSPAVSVNAFNRTQNLNELYMSVFRPSTTARWNGNVKKYTLAPGGDILGRDISGNEVLAVNPLKGVFLPGVASLWPDSPIVIDGEDVLKGGAARAMKLPDSRNIYTNELGVSSVASLKAFSIDDIDPSDAADVLGYTALGLTPPACPSPASKADADNPAVCQLIDWIRGADVADVLPAETKDASGNVIPAGNGDFAERRYDMGDPLHTRPAVVIYGGDAADPETVVFSVTNDGFLHAFDPDSGEEYWAFIPWDLLDRMLPLYRNGIAKPRTSLGLDGTLRVLKLDKNRNGIVDAESDGSGDRVILYFGMRRGGSNYYAVDVTNKESPELLWIAGPTTDAAVPASNQLPLIGQTWSRPVVTRMKVPGHSNTNGTTDDTTDDNYVVMFGGGYDPDQDVAIPQAYVDDDVGTGIYMLDAFTGELLWRAGPDSGAELQLSEMTAAIPADLTALELTNDGFVDLVYVGDLQGRVWRLDFDSNASTVKAMVTGGVFADLGGSGVAGARRFFTSPDVSSVILNGQSYFNVAIGSGNREMPLSDSCSAENIANKYGGVAADCEETDDRFYSLRDFNKLVPYDWSDAEVITESDLTDVTPTAGADGQYSQAAVPAGSVGWLLRLDTFTGEKAISSSATFDNTIFFPTFIPLKRSEDTDNDACTDALGYNNLYKVSVFDASPSKYLSDTAHTTVAGGLAVRLEQFGIAPSTVFLFPGADGDENNDQTRPPPICLIGVESCGKFAAFEPKRTYWRHRGAE
jgi:hypothetical protein